MKLSFVEGPLGDDEREDLVNLAVNGEVPEPHSELGEHINDCWVDLNGPSERSLVHWIRRLVFRGAWLDQRVMEGELEIVFDEDTSVVRLRPAGPQLRAHRALARAELASGRLPPLSCFSQARCKNREVGVKRKVVAGMAAAIVVLGVTAPAASAKERAAHALLAQDPVAAVRARHAPGRSAARTASEAPAKPGYITGFEGDGAGRLQEPERQAAADREDDGAPLPLLRPRPRGRGPGSCWRGARLHRRARRGAPARPLRNRAARRSAQQVRDHEPEPRRRRARLAPHRDGDEPLQAPEELLRAHEGLVHDREAHVGACRS